MTGGKAIALGSAIVVCLALLVVPTSAGVLPGHPNAYNGWSGSTSFANEDYPDELCGRVEWAVFGPGDLPFDPGGAWTPTPGELTYVYQVFSTGTDAISSCDAALYNVADNIGAFVDDDGEGYDITGIPPSSMNLEPEDSAHWGFSSPAIGTNENSSALVYCSPNIPTDLYALVVNGGHSAWVIPVPSPGDESIPEPGTITLLVTGLGAMALARFGLRRQMNK